MEIRFTEEQTKMLEESKSLSIYLSENKDIYVEFENGKASYIECENLWTTPEDVKKREPMKGKTHRKNGMLNRMCPYCEIDFGNLKYRYCPFCGQQLEW